MNEDACDFIGSAGVQGAPLPVPLGAGQTWRPQQRGTCGGASRAQTCILPSDTDPLPLDDVNSYSPVFRYRHSINERERELEREKGGWERRR